MEIAVAIHKDEKSVYGVIVPDVPGCFSWGDSIEDALRNTHEAIHSHLQALLAVGAPIKIRPSKIEDLTANDAYLGAVWKLVQVDLSKIELNPKRNNSPRT